MNTENTVNQRIKILINSLNISVRKFAFSVGVSDVAIHNITSGKANPSFELLSEIVKNYPNISLEWLIKGQGEMFGVIKPLQNSEFLMDENRRLWEHIKELTTALGSLSKQWVSESALSVAA